MTMWPGAPASINYSVVPATVTKNDDQLGRVRVRFPWMEERAESDWLAVAGPGAGSDRGLYYVPQVNDLVLVAFSYGQADKGYVIGSLWSSADKPPSGGDPNKRTLKSVSGHVITLDDTKDAERISIVDKSGENLITLDTKTKTITIESGGDITIKAKGNLALHSDKDLAITGKTVTLEATSKLAAKGREMALNGPQGVKVNDGALEVV
jgi:phage baseplate assembly protein V